MKEYFLLKLADTLSLNNNSCIIDLGSGTSEPFLSLLKKFPNLKYVGIEPDKKSAAVAAKSVSQFSRARIINKLGYQPDQELLSAADLCISLSALEHIKNLESFIKTSIAYTKPGGYVLHRYDLGHALYPSSIKERLQLFLSRYIPSIIPEDKYVAYVSSGHVTELLAQNGAVTEKITYHQMPNHKEFLKFFPVNQETRHLAEQIIQWEMDVSQYLELISLEVRERLFPAVAVWAKRL